MTEDIQNIGAISGVNTLKDRVGQKVGHSSWIVVDQAMINRFADATNDHQYIHVDLEAAAKTEFGGTIAHGLLTLSLLPSMFYEVYDAFSGGETGVNYGFDSVRFLSPVPSGARVRGVFLLTSMNETQLGTHRLEWDVTVEIEGSEKPALVAKWIDLLIEAAE